MKAIVETGMFILIAVAVHAVGFGWFAHSGAQSAGAAGVARQTLAASSAGIDTMVRRWEAPPTVQAVFDAPAVPTTSHAQMPSLPPSQAVPRPAVPTGSIALPPAAESPPAKPKVDTQTPPRPPKKAAPKPRPQPTAQPQAPAKPKPKPKPQAKTRNPAPKTANSKSQPSAGQKAQKAAGKGQGKTAGAKQKAATSTLSKGKQAKLIQKWGGQIRRSILRKKRTPATRATGRTVLSVTVARNGQILGVKVRQSSGNRALDQAAVKSVRAVRRVPKAPKGLSKNSYSFNLPLSFKP